MKRMFILAVALLAALAISAQEPNKFGLKKPDSPRSGKYELPDSLRCLLYTSPSPRDRG